MTHCRCLLLAGLLAVGCDSLDDDRVPPILHDDVIVLQEDEELDFASMFENDEGDIYDMRIVVEPSHGKADGYYDTYAPNVGYFGADRFVYGAADVAQATVDITIVSDGIPNERAAMLDDLQANDMEVGDISGDGAPDLVTCDHATSSFSVLVNRTTAFEQFAVVPQRFEAGYTPRDVALADFDADGKLDVVTAAEEVGLVVLRNTTSSAMLTFDAPLYLPGTVQHVAATDLDGDNRVDLVALDGAGVVRLRLNRSEPGSLAFAAESTMPVTEGTQQLAASDFDHDGRGDIAVLSADPGVLSIFTNATLAGDSVVTFDRAERATGIEPTRLFVADITGDQRRDFGVVHDNGSLWIYVNRAVIGEPPQFDAAHVVSAPGARRIEPAQLDGNAGIDLVVAGSAGAISYFMQTEPGVFEENKARIGRDGSSDELDVGAATAVRVIDLDGVPPHEIAVASSLSYNYARAVHVLFGK